MEKMSDVRHGDIHYECEGYSRVYWHPGGTHAIVPREEYERLRKLADAVCGARNATDNEQFCRAMDVVVERLRELEDS